MATSNGVYRGPTGRTDLKILFFDRPDGDIVLNTISGGSGDDLTELINSIGTYTFSWDDALIGVKNGTIVNAAGQLIDNVISDSLLDTTGIFEVYEHTAANVSAILGRQIKEIGAENWISFFQNLGNLTLNIVDNVGVSTDIESILGEPITETTAGNIAKNLSLFYDNNDLTPTVKIVDDVGEGGLSEADLIAIIAGVQAVSDNIEQAGKGNLTAYEKTTWVQKIGNLTALAPRTDAVFSLKRKRYQPDADSILLVSETLGLIVLNGTPVTTPNTLATLVIHEGDGSDPENYVTLNVSSPVMDDVPTGKWMDGLKLLNTTQDTQLRQGSTIVRESVVDAFTPAP